jgi:cytochrome c oxidase cbb3-type subunit III
MAKNEVDKLSGVQTTGHVWDDDLKELNNPLPKWWITVFWITVVWAIAYYFVYPSWPLLDSYAKGMKEWSSRKEVGEELVASKAALAVRLKGLETADLEQIKANPDLLKVARAAGKAAFGDNCAACHGSGAEGGKGYPNLNDDDWLWSGSLSAIQTTITHGVRADDKETRTGEMLAFGGKDGPLSPTQIQDVAAYVRSLTDLKSANGDVGAGRQVFAENCVSCHGEQGKGNPEMGAPNLTDGIWLYGGDEKTVIETITNGRKGVMPAWGERFKNDPTTIKALTVYVHSLGGGK